MKLKREDMLLYAVTDRAWVGKESLYRQVEAALKGGASCVQLREKDLDYAAFRQEAVDIKELCHEYRVPFIINDNVALAVEIGADGVHVGQDDMNVAEVRRLVGNDMIIGVSTKTVEQALAAQAGGADYLGVGAMFATSTKHDAKTIDKQALFDICRSVNIPVVAIGGITKENMPSLKDSGIAGVALVSAIFAQEDIEKACAELKKIANSIVG